MKTLHPGPLDEGAINGFKRYKPKNDGDP